MLGSNRATALEYRAWAGCPNRGVCSVVSREAPTEAVATLSALARLRVVRRSARDSGGRVMCVLHDLDAQSVRHWLTLAADALERHQAEINALNVFPVPDGDTGSNMALTMAAGVRATDGLAPGVSGRVLADSFSSAALAGARGNSGIILSQYVRAFLERLDVAGPAGTSDVVAALSAANESAYAAVGAPTEGTILTVARAAADSANAALAVDTECSLNELVRQVALDAATALERTPEQLPALARAGVVDAGGRGLVVLLESLVEVVTGRRVDAVPEVLAHPRIDECTNRDGAFEVMYLLECSADRMDQFREQLAATGTSIVVAGAEPAWSVHVHTDDVGSAIEAGLAVGRPTKIRIADLRVSAQVFAHPSDSAEASATAARVDQSRHVVAVAHGQGMEDLLASSAVSVVRAHGRVAPSTGEILTAMKDCGGSEFIVLPSSAGIRSAAEAAAELARAEGLTVTVIPTRSIVQTLAAVAVHDPQTNFDGDVLAMTRAATATRYGGVSIATRNAMTSAGLCSEGDVLGIIEGDVVEIGHDVSDVAYRLMSRLLSAGGELVTLVRGQDSSAEMITDVVKRIRREHPAIEVSTYDGGQPVWPLIVGVE